MLQDSVLKDMPTSPRVARILQAQNAASGSSSKTPSSPQLQQQQQVMASTSTPLSDHLRSTTRLFRLLSDRTDIDHPLCAECTDVLLSAIQKQLDETKRERDGYLAFERDIKKDKSAGTLPMRSAALAREESAAAEELRDAEREVARLAEELADLERQERELAEDEAEFWREHNRRAEQASRQEAELRSLQAAYAADRETADMLEQSNVYNDAFLIAADGPLATINGLRFGRMAGAHVDWPEINAAWGQTLLLLYTIARKIDFTFDTYTLHPSGSYSRIERHGHGGDATTTLELYYSEDNPLMRILHNYRFDAAMVAFLECLRQITDYAARVGRGERFDFPVCVVQDCFACNHPDIQQDIQGQDWRRVHQVWIQHGGCLDPRLAAGSDDLAQPSRMVDAGLDFEMDMYIVLCSSTSNDTCISMKGPLIDPFASRAH